MNLMGLTPNAPVATGLIPVFRIPRETDIA